MAEYRICFSIAGDFGVELSFETKAGVSYDDAAASIDKAKLAEMLNLNILGYTENDIEVITPEEYDAEFGDADNG